MTHGGVGACDILRCTVHYELYTLCDILHKPTVLHQTKNISCSQIHINALVLILRHTALWHCTVVQCTSALEVTALVTII